MVQTDEPGDASAGPPEVMNASESRMAAELAVRDHFSAPVAGSRPRTVGPVVTSTFALPRTSAALPTAPFQLGVSVATLAGVTAVSSRFQARRLAPCPDITQLLHAVVTTTRTTSSTARRNIAQPPQIGRNRPVTVGAGSCAPQPAGRAP